MPTQEYMVAASNSIIREIQSDIIGNVATTSGILRKARLAARKLELQTFQDWIIRESDGYRGMLRDDIPDYRVVPVLPRFHNPYNGWCPIICEHKEMHTLCHTVPLTQSIVEIEELARSDEQVTLSFHPELTKILRTNLEFAFEIRAFVSSSALRGPVNAVTNIILDWAIDLEKAGILGEGLSFSKTEQIEAAAVTQNIYAHNIGNFGTITGGSTVTINQELNSATINHLLQKIEEVLPVIPHESRQAIELKIKQIKSSESSSDTSLLMQSILRICEGIATNIAASGIITLLRPIFG